MDTLFPYVVKSCLAGSAIFVSWLVYIAVSRPEPVFPLKQVEDLIAKNAHGTDLKKIIVLITGSTGGIGLKVAEELYSRGVTVIIASRTESKCKQTVEDLKKLYPTSTGALDYCTLDTGDLDSVKAFTVWYKSKFSYLTILLNNAGQHYAQGETHRLGIGSKMTTITKQGYDEVFAINYLGHFLLTNELLPLIKKGRVISVASAYHWAADGKSLQPRAGKMLDAANGVDRDFQHRRAAYAVTKLAQVLHMRELQRRLIAEGRQNDVIALSLCPGWVQTNMIPHGLIGKFINSFNFTVQCSTLAPLSAIFDPSLKGGEFASNYVLPLLNRPWIQSLLMAVFSILPIRPTFIDIFAMFLAMLEARSYGYYVQISSPESKDAKLARGLYDWSLQELATRGYITA